MRYSEERLKICKAYSFNINPTHINSLKTLIKFVADNDGQGAMLGELGFGPPQYNGFRTLNLLGLVGKVFQAYDGQFREREEGDDEARSVWFPTEFGKQYANGEAACYDKVATLDNEILPYDHEAWQGVKSLAVLKTAAEIYANPNYERYREMFSTGNPNELTEKQYKKMWKEAHPTIRIREEIEDTE